MAFLSARWSNLILITYAVPPDLLARRLPDELELDTRDGRAFASLVAFDFLDTRVLGVRWPGFVNFPEVNLRFYVRQRDDGERGVMFVREFVPHRFVAWMARAVYNEPYAAVPMTSRVETSPDTLAVSHELSVAGTMIRVADIGDAEKSCPAVTSDEHFFKEHRWGFNRSRRGRCIHYEVIHPAWNCHRVRSWNVELDWAAVYGSEWRVLQDATPCSVILAEGSAVEVLPKRSVPTGCGELSIGIARRP
jgi:uncharacterized protein